MSILVECIEPEGMPLKQSLNVQLLQCFRLYLLNDRRFDPPGGLRSTIILPIERHPPPEASLVMELDVYNPGAGDPLVFRIKRMGRHVYSDLVRPNVRSRLAEGHEVPSGSRIELIQDSRKIPITLQLESDLMRTKKGVGAGAIRHKTIKSISVGAFLYDSVMALVVLNGTIIRDKIILYLRKLGVHPTVFLTLGSLGLVVGAAGFLAWNRHSAAEEAEQKADVLEEASEKAEAAREDALNAAMECLAEQQRLADILGDIRAKKEALIMYSLEQSKERTAVKDYGDSAFFREEVKPYDKQFQESVLQDVVGRLELGSVSTDILESCMEYTTLLNPDLPGYVLTWHPSADLVCTANYDQVVNGVKQRGLWGLSDRVSVELGALNTSAGSASGVEQLTSSMENLTGVGDPRMAPSWSAHSLVLGLREVQLALLSVDAGERPIVAPSQVNLWTLALWDAYNQMPSPADGTLNKTIGECVEGLLDQAINGENASVIGMPVLPDITAVAAEAKMVVAPTTSGCPWIGGSVRTGAENALQAVADYTSYLEQVGVEEERKD